MAVVSTMVGEFVVQGAPLLWVWAPSPDARAPDPRSLREALRVAVRLGYERTAEQDVAFGVRQLADIAVKALSPAINDPYTAIQALEHLGVLLARLVRRPLGNQRLHDDDGTTRVVIPGRDLSYYLDLATGQIRRFGCAEPRVDRALLRVLATTGMFSSPGTYSSWSKTPSGPSHNRLTWRWSAPTPPLSCISSLDRTDAISEQPVGDPPRCRRSSGR